MADDPQAFKEQSGRILEELKEKRAVPLAGFAAGNPEVLKRVREYEKEVQQVHMHKIASAKGEDIDKLTLLDSLTELYNFRTFIKELKAELARARRYQHSVALCVLSIDGIDNIRQQYGHLTSDAVLRVAANVIRNTARETDVCARYDSSKFIIILPQTHAAGASLLAERLRQRIGNQVITHNWQNFSVTATVGIASYPSHAKEYDELTGRALEALEFGIQRGGDRVFTL